MKEHGLFYSDRIEVQRSPNMGAVEKVCIKCRAAGELKMVRIRDKEKVVGILYSCAKCFHEI
jgi:hypothetical protein